MHPIVRTIRDDEFVAWTAAVQSVFFESSPPGPAAEARRPHTDLTRVWAAFDGDRIVGTLRSLAIELTVPGCARLAVDAVTAVTVRPTHRRRGILTRMIAADLEAAVDRDEALSILIASEYPIYGRFGYGPATEQVTWTLDSREATFRAPASGSVEQMEPAAARPIVADIFERHRRRQPGEITRRPIRWDVDLGLERPPDLPPFKGWIAVHRDDAGEPDAYAVYTVDDAWEDRRPNATLTAVDLHALSAPAYAAIWRYLAEVDLIARVKAENRRATEPLPFLLVDGRAARQTLRADLLWTRLLDVERALAARTYEREGRVVIETVDPLGFASGRFALDAGDGRAACRRTTESADLTVGIDALGAAYLGGTSLRRLAHGGGIDEHRPGAIDLADGLLRTAAEPWCTTWF